MLKRILFASVLVAGAARAEDTKPVLQGISECNISHHNIKEVKLAFTVSTTGTVQDIQVEQSSGNAGADEEVAKCVSRYTYKPATHNGVPVTHPESYTFHQAYIPEMEDGDHKAFAKLERDADRRCHKLFPIDRRFFTGSQPISLVDVTRQNGGEPQLTIRQSAGETADRNAIACLKKILPDHEDLPANFSRGIAVDWAHR